jgi:tetratricopeptide (TPR) repeat protein
MLCLLLLCRIAAPASANGEPFSILDEALWKVSLSFYLENPSKEIRDCELTIPALQSEYPVQQVVSACFPMKPARTGKDRSGNQTGTWKASLKPEERALLVFSYVIKTRHVRWSARPDSSRGKAPAESASAPGLRPVRIAAQAITEGEMNPYYRSVSLFDFIISNYRFEDGNAGKSDLELSMKPTVRCSGAALLYSELLKASGIASRYVGGLYVSPGRESYSEFHAWTELSLPGCPWASADPTLGRFDSGNRLRCLMERRTGYITLWKGDQEPFKLASTGGGKMKTGFSFLINVKRLRDDSTGKAEKPADLKRYYSGMTPQKRRPWKSSGSDRAVEHYNAGRRFERDRRYNRAAEEYFKALAIAPAYMDPVNGLLRLCGDQSERAVIRQALRDRGLKSQKDGLAWYALGEVEASLNHRTAAAEAYEKADRAGFLCEELYLSKMRLYERTKELEAFERAFCSLTALGVRSHEAYRKALLFFQDLELWDRCIYWCGKGTKELPESSLFPGIEGYALMQKGDLESAAQAIDKAISLDPGMGWYYCIRGWIQLRQGDRAAAERSIEKGIVLGKGVQNPSFFRSLLKSPSRQAQ